MNILILHGENSNDSFKRLSEVIDKCREKSWEIQRLGDTALAFSELFSNASLFVKKRLIVVDNLSEVSKKDFLWLDVNFDNFDDAVVFYSGSELTPGVLKLFSKKAKIEEFKLAKPIWNFLDSFFPGNSKNTLYLLKKVLEKEAPELVLALLSRHLSNLYICKADPAKLGLPAWRINKLMSQARHFSLEKLKEVIGALAEADIASKTSKGNLADSLDMLILNKLG